MSARCQGCWALMGVKGFGVCQFTILMNRNVPKVVPGPASVC